MAWTACRAKTCGKLGRAIGTLPPRSPRFGSGIPMPRFLFCSANRISLPAICRASCTRKCPGARILTVLQNVDALYWRAAGERADKVEAVRISEDVLCVFNSTPLEKYESYRLFLDQWSRCDRRSRFRSDDLQPDRQPGRVFSRSIAILRTTARSPKFLVDMLPEVYGGSSDAMLRRLLSRKGVSEPRLEAMLASVEERGSAYFREVNAFYVREFQMMHAAEDADAFSASGLPGFAAALKRRCQTRTRRVKKIRASRDSRCFLHANSRARRGLFRIAGAVSLAAGPEM